MKLIFVGDVVAGIGRRTLAGLLPGLRERYRPDFVVVNGENAAGGVGITRRTARELFELGADAITLGNHAYRHREVYAYLDEEPRIVRPANYPKGSPGHGHTVVEANGQRLGVVNLCGQVFLSAVRSPFAEADALLADLGRRGSPSHDGVSARLAALDASADGLSLDLQPAPWSARLLSGDKHDSVAVVCVVRSGDGRWLAGRRAPWLAIWPGVWMLGGAGGVDPGEDVVAALAREVEEEWSAQHGDLTVEAVVRLPDGIIWVVGQTWLERGAEITPDAEHDETAWWPAAPSGWPAEARPELRALVSLLSG